jgi:cell division protein FtsN
MNPRDQISINSQSILWVSGVGVGLLTLAFVLGVQVGKQSAALRRPMQKGVEDELKDLPEPLVDQLKIFEGDGPDKLVLSPKVEATAPKEEVKSPAKPDAKAPEKAAGTETWTLQLLATPDAAEAKRVTDKAKAAGFATTTVKEKGQLKVRLTKPADRAAVDKTAEKLKKAGFKPFAVKVE